MDAGMDYQGGMRKVQDWLESTATACLKEDADWRQRE